MLRRVWHFHKKYNVEKVVIYSVADGETYLLFVYLRGFLFKGAGRTEDEGSKQRQSAVRASK